MMIEKFGSGAGAESEAQKHVHTVDPDSDPDPQHRLVVQYIIMNELLFCFYYFTQYSSCIFCSWTILRRVHLSLYA
jgi:hypothetical protein